MKISPLWIKFLPPTVVVNVATLGPIGLWGRAPGTNGTIAGIIFYTLFFYPLSPLPYALWAAFFIYLGIVFCGQAEVWMGKSDPGEIILDEFVAIPLCFIGTHYIMDEYPVWIVMLLVFCLFRFFDILKLFGIKRLQKLEGGLGVVADDLAAAIATCVCIHIIFYAWGYFS